MVLITQEKAVELGVQPLARFVGYAVAGVPPEIMGIGPGMGAAGIFERA